VTVSKDQGVSSALWILLRDATSWLLRMRPEIDKPDVKNVSSLLSEAPADRRAFLFQ
jgi:aminoglycoside phosphotransferase (APT) family kinase protein